MDENAELKRLLAQATAVSEAKEEVVTELRSEIASLKAELQSDKNSSLLLS